MTKIWDVHKIWDKKSEKDIIDRAIRRIDKRIIVFIDDFDRLLREEIMEVFKLIDGNASFTNLIFISAYDKKYLNNIIENKQTQNSCFADKFFTIEMHLPMWPYARIYDYLLGKMSEHLELPDEVKDEYNRIMGSYLDIIQRYLPTMRDVKRFLNLFVPRFAAMKEEVVFRDFFLLSLIKYKHLDEYFNLRSGQYTETSFMKNSNQYYIKENIKESGTCESFEILNILFSSNPSYRSINNKNAFKIYFYESVVDGMKIEDMENIFAKKTLEEAYKYIDGIDQGELFKDFLSYLDSINIMNFSDFKMFERYVDILMYILSHDAGSIYTELSALNLINRTTMEQICDKYKYSPDQYKKLMISKFRGYYPQYPWRLVSHIIIAKLRNEFTEDIIFELGEVQLMVKDAFMELCEKENIFTQHHLDLMYSCITEIDKNTDKVVLDEAVCQIASQKIKENPQEYFKLFVRLGGVSAPLGINSIACEPFWRQIFGAESEFEKYMDGLTERDVPNILCVKNFWKLYKNNGYTPIEFRRQGSVQEKIDNSLQNEVRLLEQLQKIEQDFILLEEERLSATSPQKCDYKETYKNYLQKIDDTKLYIRYAVQLRESIEQVIAQL